jgi:hypothetical protein
MEGESGEHRARSLKTDVATSSFIPVCDLRTAKHNREERVDAHATQAWKVLRWTRIITLYVTEKTVPRMDHVN